MKVILPILSKFGCHGNIPCWIRKTGPDQSSTNKYIGYEGCVAAFCSRLLPRTVCIFCRESISSVALVLCPPSPCPSYSQKWGEHVPLLNIWLRRLCHHGHVCSDIVVFNITVVLEMHGLFLQHTAVTQMIDNIRQAVCRKLCCKFTNATFLPSIITTGKNLTVTAKILFHTFLIRAVYISVLLMYI